MVNVSWLGESQEISPTARDFMSRIGDNMCCGPEQPLPATAETIMTHSHMAEATLSPPQVTRLKRHAAVKALHTLSVAYEPLIIHAEHSERRSSVAFADGVPKDRPNGVEGSSALLVIDDMLPPADGSEGESDAYEATISRKRRQRRTEGKKKRSDGGADVGLVRRPRGNKRVEKLDRDDLRLIARAAQGLMSADQKKNTTKKEGKREEMLCALRRVEVEEFVKFVEETVDWSIAAARLSEVKIGPNKQQGTAEQAQLHTTSQGLLHTNFQQTRSNVAHLENDLTAESLREHWKDVLSSRIVSMYLE